MLDVQAFKEIIYSIFSSTGYAINNINVQFPHPLDIKIVKNADGDISLDFTQSLPKVSWKKLITFTAWVQGISLGKTKGVLKLKYFPDITFNYDDPTPKLFGCRNYADELSYDIESEFGNDPAKKKIADHCLHYANEWATIASASIDSCDSNERTRKALKEDCRQFVMENIKNDKEIIAKSAILSFLLLWVVLPAILNYVLTRLFKRLFG